MKLLLLKLARFVEPFPKVKHFLPKAEAFSKLPCFTLINKPSFLMVLKRGKSLQVVINSLMEVVSSLRAMNEPVTTTMMMPVADSHGYPAAQSVSASETEAYYNDTPHLNWPSKYGQNPLACYSCSVEKHGPECYNLPRNPARFIPIVTCSMEDPVCVVSLYYTCCVVVVLAGCLIFFSFS